MDAVAIVPVPDTEIFPDVEIFPEPVIFPTTLIESPDGSCIPPSAVINPDADIAPVRDKGPFIVVFVADAPIDNSVVFPASVLFPILIVGLTNPENAALRPVPILISP